MAEDKETIEKRYKKMREISKKMKKEEPRLFQSYFEILPQTIEEIIERKITKDELWFYFENYGTGPTNVQDLIPYNKRFMQMFINR